MGFVQVSKSLTSSGYRVFQRTVNTQCRSLSKLENSFLVIKRRSNANNNIWETETEEIFVELNFKEHFISPLLPNCYDKLLDALPAIVVAERRQFRALVSCISNEMRKAFAQSNKVLPPWRTERAILSNWCSLVYEEIELPDFGSATFNNEVEEFFGASIGSSSPIYTGSWKP